MSAYGAIATPKPTEQLSAQSYSLPNGLCVTTHPVYGSDTDPKLIDYFHGIFNDELAGGYSSHFCGIQLADTLSEGKTYPQQGPLTREEFANYFFGSVTIIGVLHDSTPDVTSVSTLEEAIAGRTLEEAIAGCYYMCVKS